MSNNTSTGGGGGGGGGAGAGTGTGSELDHFLAGPLAAWVVSCLPQVECLPDYSSLCSGRLIHEVVLQIDPEPPYQISELDNLEENALITGRIKNFDCIIKNIKTLYEEELGQTLLVLPECITLGRNPESREGLENMKLLLLLLLGAAVQCPNKEIFITRIKELDVETQHGIVECIKQVTDNQTVVLTTDSVELFQTPAMFDHVRRLVKERDHYLNHWTTLVIADSLNTEDNSKKITSKMSSPIVSDSNHLAVELADWKARFRKQRQELEEKSEQLSEYKEELEHTKTALSKLKVDSNIWCTEARKTAAYRDEVDALRERAERADRLESEVQKYREKLTDMDFYKARELELREDNRVLMETREMLEEQLSQSRKRADKSRTLEHELVKMKQRENDVALERDVNQQKIQELTEENAHLQYIIKSTLNSSSISAVNEDVDASFQGSESGDNSLSEQLTSNAQARALKLELENKRLMSTIDSLKEQSFHESIDKFLEVEKEKKKLALKCEQLKENCNRLHQQNTELENIFKNALEENQKLQDIIDNQKQNTDRLNTEREADRTKIQEFEKYVESLNNDKQKIRILYDSVQRRAEDLERSVESKTNEIDTLKPTAQIAETLQENLANLQNKVETIEKENSSLTKEVSKLKEIIETKDIMLDECHLEKVKSEKDISKMSSEIEQMTEQLNKMHVIDKKSQELDSQAKVDKETIKGLQESLVEEKVNAEKVKSCIEKLGLNVDDIINNELVLEELVEKIIHNSDISSIIDDAFSKLKRNDEATISPIESKHDQNSQFKNNAIIQCEQLSAELSTLQSSYDQCQAENAKLQVTISTLKSQINSLASQQMTLQLANSQLAAEKEDVIKQLQAMKTINEGLDSDQKSLQVLHEQLNSEYESMIKERETIKLSLRDLKTENREAKEESIAHKQKIDELTTQCDSLKVESRNLTNLRKEHSKLKEDFRNLFSASERLKNEHRQLQEEYRKVKSEISQLNLKNTEMSGDLSTKTDIINSLELEINKITQRCEMLMHMNITLDADRRSLMDHVSCLLTQYHELLAHSMEDKQHYHQEEKMFADKLNNLHRQKEKLEEKIMEHYRKLDNCTSKKKSFGSNFVKRVRKAGSDLINKVPSRSSRRSWSVDDNSKLSQSQTTLGGSESGESDPGNGEDAASSDQSVSKSVNDSVGNITPAPSASSLESPHHGSNNFSRKLMHNSFHGSLGGGDDALIRASFRRRQQHHKIANSMQSGHRNSFQGFEVAENPPNTNMTAALGLCRAGSRRAVYLAEDNSQTALPSVDTEIEQKKAESPDKSDNSKTFLIYNRVSTVIGDSAQTHQIQETKTSDKKIGTSIESHDNKETKKMSSKEVWYEYGCV